MSTEKRYWFPAKRYGWGWGIPQTWQGWAVLAAYISLMVASAFLFPPHTHPAVFAACVTVLGSLLIWVCWITGEPPRWRWGE